MAFSPEWLALREPVDHASRDAGLLARAADCAGRGAVVVDLGSGTGSTARAFDDADLQWRFVDGDRGLLDIAAARHPGSVQVMADVGDINELDFAGAGLVTASALLDLMPESWVDRLAGQLAAMAVPFYAAINYNGVMRWTPEHADDAAVTAAFNAHQTGDKGLGPAMGPVSGARTAEIFARYGYDVTVADSPWDLAPNHAGLHDALLEGIAGAAREAGCEAADAWGRARRAGVAQATCHIGHTDVLAVPRKQAGA